MFLAYFSPGPENLPGHVEEYEVLCPPSSPEHIEEDNMEEDLTAMEQDSEREAYFAKLQLLTKEKNDRIIEVVFNFFSPSIKITGAQKEEAWTKKKEMPVTHPWSRR